MLYSSTDALLNYTETPVKQQREFYWLHQKDSFTFTAVHDSRTLHWNTSRSSNAGLRNHAQIPQKSAWCSIPASVRPSKFECRITKPCTIYTHCSAWWDSAWCSIPALVHPSKFECRITKPCTGYPQCSAWCSIPASVRPSKLSGESYWIYQLVPQLQWDELRPSQL